MMMFQTALSLWSNQYLSSFFKKSTIHTIPENAINFPYIKEPESVLGEPLFANDYEGLI